MKWFQERNLEDVMVSWYLAILAQNLKCQPFRLAQKDPAIEDATWVYHQYVTYCVWMGNQLSDQAGMNGDVLF